jgi:hypothetical protein
VVVIRDNQEGSDRDPRLVEILQHSPDGGAGHRGDIMDRDNKGTPDFAPPP